MSRSIRFFVVAFLSSALLLSQAAPVLASTTVTNDMDEQARSVPVVFDALFLRPVGMLATGLGTMTFCLVAPIMMITRPTDMGAPFRALVMAPAHYTWVDPLGTH